MDAGRRAEPLSPLRNRAQVTPRSLGVGSCGSLAPGQENVGTPRAVPPGWSALRSVDGAVFYLNEKTGQTQWGVLDSSPDKTSVLGHGTPTNAGRYAPTMPPLPTMPTFAGAPSGFGRASARDDRPASRTSLRERCCSALLCPFTCAASMVAHTCRSFSSLVTPLASEAEHARVTSTYGVSSTATINLLAWRRSALLLTLIVGFGTACFVTADAFTCLDDVRRWEAASALSTDGATARECAVDPSSGARSCAVGLADYSERVLLAGVARTVVDAKRVDWWLASALAGVQWLALLPCAVALASWHRYWLSMRVLLCLWTLEFVTPFAISMVPLRFAVNEDAMEVAAADYAAELRETLGVRGRLAAAVASDLAHALEAGAHNATALLTALTSGPAAAAAAAAAASSLPQCSMFGADSGGTLFSFYSKFSMLCGTAVHAAFAPDGTRVAAQDALAHAHAPVACEDTPHWSSHGLSCEDFADRGFCSHGHVVAMFRSMGGSRHGSPEEHCCACGKGGADGAGALSTLQRALHARQAVLHATEPAEDAGGAEAAPPPGPEYLLPGSAEFEALGPTQQACAEANAHRRLGEREAAAAALGRACDSLFASPPAADGAEAERSPGGADHGMRLAARALGALRDGSAAAHDELPAAVLVLLARVRTAVSVTSALMHVGTSLRTLVPAALSLAPGLLRGALTTKTLVPQSSIPGMFVLMLPWLYCPLVWCMYDIVLQLSGSLALLGGLAVLAFGPMALFALGLAVNITKPMSDLKMKRVLRHVRWFNFLTFALAYGNLAWVIIWHRPHGLPRVVLETVVPHLLRPSTLGATLFGVSSKFLVTTLVGVDLMIREIAEQRQWELYLHSGSSGSAQIDEELAARISLAEYEDVRRLMAERTTRLDELRIILRRDAPRAGAGSATGPELPVGGASSWTGHAAHELVVDSVVSPGPMMTSPRFLQQQHFEQQQQRHHAASSLHLQ